MNIWTRAVLVFLVDIALRISLNDAVWLPDLMLILLAYLALSDSVTQAYQIAFVFGLLWDGAFFDYLGLHSTLFLLAVMLTARLRRLIWARYALSRLLLGALLSALMRFLEVIVWLSMNPVQVPLEPVYRYILAGSLMTGFAFIFVTRKPRPIRVARKVVVFGER